MSMFDHPSLAGIEHIELSGQRWNASRSRPEGPGKELPSDVESEAT